MISLLDLGVERPREAMMLRAPEAEALDGGSAPIEPRDPRVDGSPVPLGSTAVNEPIGIWISLWGRWKSPDAIGLKTLWIRKQSNTKQRNISDNQSGDKRVLICSCIFDPPEIEDH
ncbi:MAG: hypothetical protein RQ885_07360 [Desulfurococcales archaeon]|nr:hypothetical protein [Desulfurococcales archaeon]